MESTLVLIGILIVVIVFIAMIGLAVFYLKYQIQDYAFHIIDTTEEMMLSKVSNDEIGYILSEIINRDGDDLTDGECIDQIVSYLKRHNLYHERTK